jgi:acetoin:2,6-dichlorophenolindophenol oxidoreductase subunit alpha
VLDEEALASLEAAVKDSVDEAVRFALESPWPAPHEALEDVWE